MTSTDPSIAAARRRIVLDHPWWSSLVLRLPARLVESLPPPGTACTDGREIQLARAWWDALSPAERAGVLAHEALHCGLLHHLRRGARDPRRWNVACDHAVNLILLGAGMTLPTGRLADDAYAGLSAAQIYDLLPDDAAAGADASCGEVADTADDPSPAAAESEWRAAAAEAAHALARAGLGAGAERALLASLRPHVAWREVLAHLLARVGGDGEWDWRRPSRRALAQDLYLPRACSRALPSVAICVDVSGSITTKQVGGAVAECRRALDELMPERTTVLLADDRVRLRVELAAREEWSPPERAIGGGGTDFRPALAAAAESDPTVILYWSADLDGAFPTASPRADVIWLTESTSVAPCGATLRIDPYR